MDESFLRRIAVAGASPIPTTSEALTISIQSGVESVKFSISVLMTSAFPTKNNFSRPCI